MKKIFVIITILFLQSCVGGKKLNYYTLKVDDNFQKIDNRVLDINISKIDILHYLDIPQIITIKNSKYELNLSENNRWVETFGKIIENSLINILYKSFPYSNIKIEEFNRNYDINIQLKINNFVAKFNDKAVLDAEWFIYDKNNKLIKHNKFYNSVIIDDTYVDLAKKYSKLLNEMLFLIITDLNKPSYVFKTSMKCYNYQKVKMS